MITANTDRTVLMRGDGLPAMRLVQSSRTARLLANALLGLLLLAVAAMAFLPWQQSARGIGRVVAYVPQERQQTIESQVEGVVVKIGSNVVEGSRVQRGQFLLEVQPAAANLKDQLSRQKRELELKLATADVKVEVYAQNVKDFAAARDYAIQAAAEMVSAARAKLQAKQDSVRGYEAKELQARLNYERQRQLFEKGIKSEREIESLKKDWDVAVADLDAAHREVSAAENEATAKEHELEQKRNEAQTKVDYSRAMEQDALGQAATIRKEIGDVEIELGELDRLVIEAPRDGSIFRMMVYERGQLVKKGDSLLTIVPDTGEQAVELWVSGNDTPLMQPGDHVRLQFEGWPAVQFAGWPSVAVGTFGGAITSIDATDDGKGKFRLLVKPDGEQEWPSRRYLRQGVRANGWVLLRQVPLGYEIWRQLNGFPPVVAADEPDESSKDGASKVKLPK